MTNNNGTVQRLGADYAVKTVAEGVEIYAPMGDNVELRDPYAGHVVLTDEEATQLVAWVLGRQQEGEYDFVSILARLLWERRITPDAGELVIRSLIANACDSYIRGWIGELEV